MFNAFNTPSYINEIASNLGLRLRVTLQTLMQISEPTALVCLGQDIVSLAWIVERFEPGRLKRDRWE